VEAGEEIAVMFSDIRGFTSYTVRKGDRAAYDLSRKHDILLREQIEEESGIVVKTLGDGIMAAFAELPRAVDAATRIQRKIRERNSEHPSEAIEVGIGLASGTPIVTDSDLIGNSVNLSQRVSSLAKGGQILTTEEFARAAMPDSSARFVPLGKRDLKGVGSVVLYEILWIAEVARLTDRDDRVTLLLTERGTLVAELAKGGRSGAGSTPVGDPVKGSALPRGLARFRQRMFDKSMSALGVTREQPIDRVDISIDRNRVFLRMGKKEIQLRNVDIKQAASFRDMLVQMRRELYPESAKQ